MKIEDFVEKRGIKSLFHFTRVDNLGSILRHGLLTKSACAHIGCDVKFNDAYRYDGTDAVCASISFPNYKMFYPLRCDHPDVEWVVIKLKRSLLWTSAAAFCMTNAASNSVTAIPIAERQGLPALVKLFEDFDGKARADLRIPDHYTTNPQAEVLILDGVSVEAIKGVYFQKRVTMDRYAAKYDGLNVYLNGGYFDGRSDYQHWR